MLTDVVDSTRLAGQLGEVAVAALWASHDRIARDLLPAAGGREIDKTDGMLLMFDTAAADVARGAKPLEVDGVAKATATRCLDESERIVRGGPDPHQLGMLLCARAELQWLVGDVAAAERALGEAAVIAVAADAAPGSELANALARVRALLATSRPRSP